MAVLALSSRYDPVLRRKAKKVTVIDESIQRLIDDMVDTMKAAPGVGLAAPQVGVSLKIAVIGIPDEDVIVMINPEIIKKGGERVVAEGCLSIPGYYAEIVRSKWVKRKALDRHGKEFHVKGEDLLAQALEHEIDHLKGILYIDHLDDLSKLQKVTLQKEQGDPEGL
jgi:peptide deformylase